jgi:hypothetical protein
MHNSMRRFGALTMACLAAFGVLVAPAQAQLARTRFSTVPLISQQAINPNFYVNNFQTLRQATFNTAVVGNALAQVPPWVLGYNPFPNPIANYGTITGPSYGGYGAGYGMPGTTGYGLSSSGYGASLSTSGYGSPSSGYGGGYGASYDMNPYTGYLTGAAALTGANANYQKTIQDARLVHEQAKGSHAETRRKILEEATYERTEWFKRYDLNVVYQRDQAGDLDRARHDPPLTEILSGQALNSLLTHLEKQQGKGEQESIVPLTEDMLQSINVSGQETRGNPGLLKCNGRLQWPLSLTASEFADSRERLSTRLADAVNTAKNSNLVPVSNIKDIRGELNSLHRVLGANVSEMSPSQYIEAKRFLNQLQGAVKALEDPGVANYFNQRWVPQGKNVAELVKYMSDRGLVFAPAVPGDTDAYRALYRALQAFDAGVVAAGSSNGRYP